MLRPEQKWFNFNGPNGNPIHLEQADLMQQEKPTNAAELADHLFRREAGKMVSVLTKTFGVENLDLAEDVVQESLLLALQTWPFEGIPDNPSGWLYRVAKNKAIDILRRNSHSVAVDVENTPSINNNPQVAARLDGDWWHEELIKDDLLRMMFVCCHPSIPEENQICLILKTLCGFSTAEIARAVLTSEDTISKRLYRTKEIFRQQTVAFVLPSAEELKSRTDAVLHSIYLLFNEGYNSTDSDDLIRTDLIEEALLLCEMLAENLLTQIPETFALMALLCFQSSRTDSRLTPEGEIVLLPNQDRSKWNSALIHRGNALMGRSAFGNSLSKYHLEAAIAFEHCTARSFEETDWKRILELYDGLLKIAPSPVAELNRTVAVMQVHGPEAALRSLDAITDKKKISKFYLFHGLRGEMFAHLKKPREAKSEFESALVLTRSLKEQALLRAKIEDLRLAQ